MKAILKKELKSFFYAPVGYVCVAAITALYGFFYYQVMMTGSSSYVTAVYSMLFSFDMMLIPVITMKSLAEERKNKTEQALLTAPIAVWQIVAGKFLACFFVFFIASTMGLLPALALEQFGNPPWGIIMGNYIGTLLYGGAMIAIGIFLSSLTTSQVISAIATFAVSVSLMYVDAIAASMPYDILAGFFKGISFYSRYAYLTRGLFYIPSLFYFAGVMLFFLYLTAGRLEGRSVQKIYRIKAVLVGLIIVVVNLAAWQAARRFPGMHIDMTAQQLNSLSEETRQIAEKIEQPTTIYVMADEQAAREDGLYASYGIQYSQVVSLLDRLWQINPMIEVEFREPEANPALMSEYAQENLTEGSIVIKTDKRYQVLGISDLFVQMQDTKTGTYSFYFEADSALANALSYVNQEWVPQLVIAKGHGEMMDEGSRQAFEKVIKQRGFAVSQIQFMTEKIPKDTDILWLPTPTTDYTEEEIEKLRKYLSKDNAGKNRTLFVTAYPSQGELPRLSEFLEEWGIRIEEGVVCERDESKMLLTAEDTIFVEGNPVILGEKEYPLLLAPVSSAITLLFQTNDDIVVQPLWTTSEQAYIREGKQEQETGELTVASYSYKEYRKNDRVAYGNVVVAGSSLALAAPYINTDTFSNQTFLTDLFQKITNAQEKSVVMPKQVALNQVDITASRQTINLVGIGIFTVILPCFMLVIGGIVFCRRRHL